jgi:signal transduction histidine kinase
MVSVNRFSFARFASAWRAGLALLVVACLGSYVLLVLPGYGADPEAIEITQADILLGADSASPPPDSAAWKPVSLPDIWDVSRENASGYAWYRLQVALPAQPQGRQAIYINRLRHVGACFVNGAEVGQFGEFGTVSPGPRPQLFEFSPGLLHPGRNTIHVRLWVPPDWSGALSPVHLGPRQAMQGRMEIEAFWRVTAPACAIALLAFVAIVTLTLWLYRPKESTYAYIGLAALFRIPFAASEYVSTAPSVLGEVSVWFKDTSLMASVVLTCLFALRYGGWRLPRTERALWAWVAAFAVLCAIVRATYVAHYSSAVALWQVLNTSRLVVAFGYSLIFAIVAWRRRDGESILMAVAFTVSTALACYDQYWRVAGSIPWFPFRLVPLYLIVTWALMRRFARTLDDAEKLNTDLADRVESKRRELEANYLRLGELEKQQAVVAERARLMRDMHDGIGGQLISTLSLVEAGQASQDKVAAALRECIDDLRLAIDSLEPTDDDLVPVLGNLRYRVEPRLRAQGIELDWRVQDVPKLPYMTPQNVLNVLRILQEAFTNVLKHAGAGHVRVATRCEAGRVLIDVSDDGRGMSAAATHRGGHGLANMRRRAQALGGALLLEAGAQGTTVTLELPLAAA